MLFEARPLRLVEVEIVDERVHRQVWPSQSTLSRLPSPIAMTDSTGVHVPVPQP